MTLVWLAAAFIGGILLGSTVVIGPEGLVIGAIAGCLLACLLWRRYPLRLTALALVFCLLGTARGESARLHIGPDDLAYYNGRTVTLTGVVSEEPDVRDNGINYVVAVEGLTIGVHAKPIRGQLELHTAPSQIFDEGDRLQLTGALTTPVSSPAIPYRSILANRGIYSQMSYPRAFVTGYASLGLISVADQIRAWIERTISGMLPDPDATLLIAILIGARSAQLGALAPVLIQTGLIHLIAISGIKVAIVAGTVNTFFRRLTSRTPTLLLSASVLGAYWLISGATVAGLRASIMWLLVFIAAYLGRPTFALVSLGVAASAMLAVSPPLLWDTGFELTTVATASIVALSPFLERATGRLPSALGASLTTTTAAQVGVLPIQAASFHVLSPVSLLTNAVVLPFIPLTMVAGFAATGYPHPPLTAIAFSLVHMVIVVARWADRIPFASRPTGQLPSMVSLAYYASLVGLAFLAWRIGGGRRRVVHGEWILGLGVAAIGLTLTFGSAKPRNGILFVADGAALIQSHGQNVLIDGGSHPSQLLTALGATIPFPNERLDAVIDTDPGAKNVASLTAVVEHIRVGHVVDPGIEYATQTYGRWSAWLRSNRLQPIALRPGLVLQGRGFFIRALAPDAVYPNVKDGAGILLITAGAQRILYLGPASPKEQEDLPFRQNPAARIVISAVPLDPTLALATGYKHLIRPRAGTFIPFGP